MYFYVTETDFNLVGFFLMLRKQKIGQEMKEQLLGQTRVMQQVILYIPCKKC